jgi:hypothetical protein
VPRAGLGSSTILAAAIEPCRPPHCMEVAVSLYVKEVSLVHKMTLNDIVKRHFSSHSPKSAVYRGRNFNVREREKEGEREKQRERGESELEREGERGGRVRKVEGGPFSPRHCGVQRLYSDTKGGRLSTAPQCITGCEAGGDLMNSRLPPPH